MNRRVLEFFVVLALMAGGFAWLNRPTASPAQPSPTASPAPRGPSARRVTFKDGKAWEVEGQRFYSGNGRLLWQVGAKSTRETIAELQKTSLHAAQQTGMAVSQPGGDPGRPYFVADVMRPKSMTFTPLPHTTLEVGWRYRGAELSRLSWKSSP